MVLREEDIKGLVGLLVIVGVVYRLIVRNIIDR